MPYRRFKRTDYRRYTTRAQIAFAGHPEGPAMLCLGILATIWSLVGIGVLTSASRDNDALIHAMIPEPIQIAMWVIPALFAVYTLVTGRHSTVTVGLLVIAPTIRIVSYMWAWIMYLVPNAPDGLSFGWYSAAYHGLMIGLVVLASMLTRGDGLEEALSAGDDPDTFSIDGDTK